MQNLLIPVNEKERLETLYSYQLLDNIEQKEFNEIVKIAAHICDTPISLITLIDQNNQWHKARIGLDMPTIPRRDSFCNHGIRNPDVPLIVKDATIDDRFKDNPLVTGTPNIVFYAGVSLVTGDGYPLGALCVIDNSPREITEQQLDTLHALSNQVIRLFELRKTIKVLEKKEHLLEQTIKNLEDFTTLVAHDLKTPLRNIEITAELLKKKYAASLDAECKQHLTDIQQSSFGSMQFINNTLKYAKSIHTFKEDFSSVDTKDLLKEVCKKLQVPADVKIVLDEDLPTISNSRMALQHIFENLIQNSIKYRDKKASFIHVLYEEEEEYHRFKVSDNGPGIPNKHYDNIFKLFHKGANKSYNSNSSGIGLAIVNKLVQLLKGKISLESTLGQGTTFTLLIPKLASPGS